MVTLVNRAKVSTSTTGTGAVSFGAAVDGYQTFSAAGVAGSSTVRYVIEDGDAWEIGTGGINAAVTTMSRTLIESSTGSALNLSGEAVVYVTAAAQDVVQPSDLATVATTGAYSDLTGKPTLGTAAAADTGDFATAAQGSLADSAVQPNDSPTFGSVTVTGTVDGRDVAADGSKLDGIEAGANVTDTANVTAAGALMDSEVTNLAQVKAFDSADYATAAQGSLADSALQSGDNVSALTNDAGYTTNVGDITGVTAGSGITGGGTSGTVTINHADTSSQGSVNNSGATVIQDVTVDTYGHVTGLGSATIIPATIGAATSAQGALADSAVQPNDSPTFGNVTVTGTVDGRDVAADGSKLDGIEAGADVNPTASEILTSIKTVDGAGSGLDADLLDGQQGSYYYPASNPNGYTTNTGDITGVTAGTGLSGGGASGSVTLNVDLSELTDMTATMVGTDEFIVLDAGADRRKAANEIGLSIFSNDAGFTTNVGDITGVTAGSGISGGGTSGTVTINHADTSAQSSVNNSGATVIQDVTLDTYGHVTALGSKTLTAADVGAITGNQTITLSGDLSGSGTTSINAQIASGVVGATELNVTGNGTTAQFLRSDGDGSFTWATPTDTNTTYSAGTALDLSGTTFNVDLSELSTSTTNGDGDYFVVTDTSNAQRKLTKGNINISGFNNDAGFTTNVGDITGVTAGTSLTGGGTSGTVTINHADTSTLSGTYGSTADGTKIDQITVDALGHVTAITTGATGDIQGVTAGTGLTGGGTSGTVTLNADVGTTASKIVQLDGSARLPAVDGSQLTNLPAGTPSTADVLSATAGATAGAVGTYAFLVMSVSTDYSFGATLSGSSLRPVGMMITEEISNRSTQVNGWTQNSTQAGTWRCMGRSEFYNPGGRNPTLYYGSTLWLRIS